ncbi:MAG: hypothetical protein WBB28_01670 [Crinalium sp.]
MATSMKEFYLKATQLVRQETVIRFTTDNDEVDVEKLIENVKNYYIAF